MTAPGRRFDADRIRLGLRLLVLLAACLLAGAPLLLGLGASAGELAGFGWVVIAPLIALPVAWLRHRALVRVVHVHDRQFDLLVLVSLLVVVVTSVTLLSERLGWAGTILRLDLLMVPVFVAAVIVALFGTRPMMEQLPSLWVAGAVWPFPYAVIASYVPIDRLGWLIGAWVATVTVVALHHTSWVAVLGSAVVAITVVDVIAVAQPDLAPFVALLGPSIVLAIARLRRWPDVFSLARAARLTVDPPAPLAVGRGRRAAGLILVVAVVIGALVHDAETGEREPVRTVLAGRGCPRVDGWRLVDGAHIGDEPERKGGGWGSRRCRFRITDELGERDIAIDISDRVKAAEVVVFPAPVLLRGPGRLDPARRRFDVAGGKGEVFVYSDATIPTELTIATVDVEAPGDQAHLRRVTVLVPDDRRPTVRFPLPKARVLVEALRQIGVVVRSQQEQLDEYAVDSKDVALSQDLLRRAIRAASAP